LLLDSLKLGLRDKILLVLLAFQVLHALIRGVELRAKLTLTDGCGLE
jgi:hypothetical protein